MNKLQTEKKPNNFSERRQLLPFFIPHEGCPGRCVFCDQRIVSNRQSPPEIAEIISAVEKLPEGAGYQLAFYGGSFTALSSDRQRAYLSAAQNGMRTGRLHSIRISTRPDCIDTQTLLVLKEYGVGCVELGVQSLDGEVLAASGRGYSPKAVCSALELLKKHDFAVGVQLMPGLPGDTYQKSLRAAFTLARMQPELLRLYPTVVIRGTELEDLYQKQSYSPLTMDEAVILCRDMAAVFLAVGTIVARLGLQPSEQLEQSVVAGPYHPAFGELVYSALARQQLQMLLEGWQGGLCLFAPREYLSRVSGYCGENKRWLRETVAAGVRLGTMSGLPEKSLSVARAPRADIERSLDWGSFLTQYVDKLQDKLR